MIHRVLEQKGWGEKRGYDSQPTAQGQSISNQLFKIAVISESLSA
jgi:hypothetical protein